MSQTTNDTNQSSLDSFSFDNPSDGWFGVKSKDLPALAADGIKETTGKAGQEVTNLKESKDQADDHDDFEDDDNGVFSFGSDKNVETNEPVKEVVTEADEEPKKTTPKKKVEEEEEEEEEDDVLEAKADEIKVEDEGNEEKSEEEIFGALVEDFKEKGILQNVELKEGEKITEEKFFELYESEIETRVDETFEAYNEGLDEDAKRFIEYKRKGGPTGAFMQIVAKDVSFDVLDEDDPKQVDAVIQHYLVEFEELEGEELKDRLEYIKDGGKAKKHAAKFFDKIKAFKEEALNTLVENQKKATKAQQDRIKKFNEDLVQVLDKTEKVGVIALDKNDKKLIEYATKPTVKVPNKKNVYVPPMQVKLAEVMRGETPEAKAKFLALAKVLFDDFNLKEIVAETETKTTKKFKSKIREAASSGFKGKSSGSYGGRKALADNF